MVPGEQNCVNPFRMVIHLPKESINSALHLLPDVVSMVALPLHLDYMKRIGIVLDDEEISLLATQ
jgi:hypothetical protein